MSITIPVKKGYCAIVDDQDADLADLKWYLKKNRSGTIYARGTFWRNSKCVHIYMHRIILERKLAVPLLLEQLCDHQDGDGLNNVRSNLRVATQTQNQLNQGVNTKNSSGTRGVSWNTQKQKWVAEIRLRGQRTYLGAFTNLVDAVAARQTAELELFGEFSPLVCRKEA